MPKITMEYLQANGRYRRQQAATEVQWPNFIINHHDREAHSLTDSPVFPAFKTREFETWDNLITALPPDPERYPDQLLCVCEDQNIWPLSVDVIQPDEQDMQMQFKEFGLDAEQNAVVAAARDTGAASLMNAWSIASLMVFCIVSMVILLIVLQSKAGQDFLGNVTPGVIGLW